MVQIEQHVWGMTPEGEAIIRYTLRNDSGAEVQLTNYGAAIVSVKMPDREGRIADVVLGYKHPEGYFFDGAASGKSVGRCANRIAFGQMTVEGKEYRLEVNNGVNHLHGGTKNFANRIWESRVETNRVVMSLVSENGDQGYPGELCVEAVFDFDDDNALEITYLARTDKTTVVNLTNHVYFNLDGDQTDVRNHKLQLLADEYLPVDEGGIPRDGLKPVAGTSFDFRSAKVIASEFLADDDQRKVKGYDHAFLLQAKGDSKKPVALLASEDGKLQMEVYTSAPALQFYSGNFLGGTSSRGPNAYSDYQGLALESEFLPDSPNHPEWPQPDCILRPGEEYTSLTEYRFIPS